MIKLARPMEIKEQITTTTYIFSDNNRALSVSEQVPSRRASKSRKNNINDIHKVYPINVIRDSHRYQLFSTASKWSVCRGRRGSDIVDKLEITSTALRTESESTKHFFNIRQ